MEALISKSSGIRLLILDNLTAPFLSLVLTDYGICLGLTTRIVQQLNCISQQGVSVVCINNARMEEGEVTPALGQLWSTLGHVQLKVVKLADGSSQFTLAKGMRHIKQSQSGKGKKISSSVKISESGICEVT